MAKLFTIKNNVTGEIKGGSVAVAVDVIYFDAIQEHINENPDDFTNDEIKLMLGGYDMGYYFECINQVDQIERPRTIGRYTLTPII